ncbi:MAG TPA: MOSC domain-containing protein [Anaerolineales bacterium]|nr:MOSC domain-containing protein [Anaerolineales bacterium]
MDEARLDSKSVGDPAVFVRLQALELGLQTLPAAPQDAGTVVLVVRKGEGGRRETPEGVVLSPEEGVPGDAWGRRRAKRTEMQIAAVQADVARLIAHGQPPILFGDNLFLDLDLSQDRLHVGRAVLEVSPMPHNGCSKFESRFGRDALQFTFEPRWRHRNLRGIYLRVVEPGEVRPGDSAGVIERGRPQAAALRSVLRP